MGAKEALERYLRKDLKRNKPRAKKEKRQRPEKEVEQEIMPWLRKSGFDVSIVESKMQYNPEAGRRTSSGTEAGVSDIVGNTPDGIGCFIELKARGKRNTIRISQVLFLERKINSGCFSCCVDSLDSLIDIYTHWRNFLDDGDVAGARKYLHDVLPKSRHIDNELPW